MSISLVQSASGAGSNATSKAQAFTSSVTAGNLLVVCIATDNTSRAVSSVTDTRSNTWLTAGANQNSADGKVLSQIRYCITTTSGADTVTVNFSGGVNAVVAVHEFTGIVSPSSSALDVATQATSTGANPSVTLSLTTAGDLVIEWCAVENTTIPSPGSGYTTAQSGTFGTERYISAWQVANGTGSTSANFTHTAATANVHGAAFLAASGGANASSSLMLMGMGT